MSRVALDIWGYCDPCSRWFACPRWVDDQAPQPACPVCLSAPSAIENRATLSMVDHWG